MNELLGRGVPANGAAADTLLDVKLGHIESVSQARADARQEALWQREKEQTMQIRAWFADRKDVVALKVSGQPFTFGEIVRLMVRFGRHQDDGYLAPGECSYGYCPPVSHCLLKFDSRDLSGAFSGQAGSALQTVLDGFAQVGAIHHIDGGAYIVANCILPDEQWNILEQQCARRKATDPFVRMVNIGIEARQRYGAD